MYDPDEFNLDLRVEPAANWQLIMDSETGDTETPSGNPPISPTGSPVGSNPPVSPTNTPGGNPPVSPTGTPTGMLPA